MIDSIMNCPCQQSSDPLDCERQPDLETPTAMHVPSLAVHSNTCAEPFDLTAVQGMRSVDPHAP